MLKTQNEMKIKKPVIFRWRLLKAQKNNSGSQLMLRYNTLGIQLTVGQPYKRLFKFNKLFSVVFVTN